MIDERRIGSCAFFAHDIIRLPSEARVDHDHESSVIGNLNISAAETTDNGSSTTITVASNILHRLEPRKNLKKNTIICRAVRWLRIRYMEFLFLPM